MKDRKTDEIINILLKSKDFESLKDESLDINLSACAPIPLTPAENDSNHLRPSSSASDIWLKANSEYFFNDESNSKDNREGSGLFSNEIDFKINDDQNANMQQISLENSAFLKCDECCELFSNYESLKAHGIVSHRISPTAITTTTTNNANNNNNTTKNIKCNKCDNVFENDISLQEHLVSKHPKQKRSRNSNDIQECPDCGKMLKGRSMWLHRKIHSDKKQFACDHCGQKFVQKVNFTNHIQQFHTGNNPFVCSECDKSFFTSSLLLRHKKYHSSVRPFKCEKCNKMYKTERCLKVHSLIHLDKRPFVCDVCSKSFISSSKLKQHLNIHTGERPYKCKYCSRDFTNFPNWLKHTRRRHKVDHKTGELLSPEFLASTKLSAKNRKKIKIENDIKNDNLQKIDNISYTKQNQETNNVKQIKEEPFENFADDYIFDQALDLEEYYRNDLNLFVTSDNLSNIPSSKCETTKIVPSVETVFSTASPIFCQKLFSSNEKQNL